MEDIHTISISNGSADKPDFYNHNWQEKHAVTQHYQLSNLLRKLVAPEILEDIGSGLRKAGMSLRLTPYVISLIDWSQVETDPIRRQFVPMLSELEPDHPCLTLDSLEERDHSPAEGLVHRYPDKVLFLATNVCPVYCQYCTRSYAVGLDTETVQKDNIASPRNWSAAIDYIRATPAVEDVVISGGDVARLKASQITALADALLDIGHVRRIRFASRSLSVIPMKIISDVKWTNALIEAVEKGRRLFKDVCLHTHFNHPREVTEIVGIAMRQLHEAGVLVRNQTVLLRGVNDSPHILQELIKKLGRINIHPYYVYVCDMAPGIEHFRLPLGHAQKLEKAVRGSTAGFNTPLFVVDTAGGKRDVHSSEFYDREYGVSGFATPSVNAQRLFHYFDPLRSLTPSGRASWEDSVARERILSRFSAAQPGRRAI